MFNYDPYKATRSPLFKCNVYEAVEPEDPRNPKWQHVEVRTGRWLLFMPFRFAFWLIASGGVALIAGLPITSVGWWSWGCLAFAAIMTVRPHVERYDTRTK